MLDDDKPAPLPAPMWLPFALLASAAAFYSVLGMAAVMRDARFTKPAPALVAGALVGALTGVVLRRWRRLHDPWLPPERQRALVALVVCLSGAVIGFLLLVVDHARYAATGLVSGAACAVLFIPGAVFIVNAASRATRARNGSIVAGADRRSIWSTTFAAVAVAPIVAVPATAIGLVSFSLGRVAQPAVVAAATVVALVALVVLEIIEVRASSALDRIVAHIDRLEIAQEADADVGTARDLGLGDVAFSSLRLRDAYRGARHGEIALRGDPDEAREALLQARSQRRRTRTLGLIAFVAACPGFHAFAVSVEQLDIDWDPTGVAGVFDLEIETR
jgi:hypothetical protein